jgi:hypothetical protein
MNTKKPQWGDEFKVTDVDSFTISWPAFVVIAKAAGWTDEDIEAERLFHEEPKS